MNWQKIKVWSIIRLKGFSKEEFDAAWKLQEECNTTNRPLSWVITLCMSEMNEQRIRKGIEIIE